MSPSSSTSSFRDVKRTLGYLAAYALALEVAISFLLHPADLADVRQAQAKSPPRQTCLVVGDSVANQLAPPFEGAPVRRLAARFGHAGTLGDPRGPSGESLDERCAFLTTTAGATRLGDLFLLRRAVEAGATPSEIHLVLSPGGWAAGRRGNPYFEDGFTQRFSSPQDIWETYQLTSDWALAGRQAAVGWLPSVRARGPYGQRLLLALVPQPPSHESRDRDTAWKISDWNYLALAPIAQQARQIQAKLVIHMAPYSGDSFNRSELQSFPEEMRRLGLTSTAVPSPWEASLFRDGTHLKHENVPQLVAWFLEEIKGTERKPAESSR